MEVFVIIFALFTVVMGLLMLSIIITAQIIGKNIKNITYTPLSENETEYGLRTLLFMYPNATIHTPQNEISKRLTHQNTRIIALPEI